MKKNLSKIAKEFNKSDIQWFMGSSFMLYSYGSPIEPNDLDIFVRESDWNRASSIMDNIADKKETSLSDIYLSKHFSQYQMGDTEIDLISEFTIAYQERKYIYPWKKSIIGREIEVYGEKVFLARPEDWYVLYSLMPKRENKVRLTRELLLDMDNKLPNLDEYLQGHKLYI